MYSLPLVLKVVLVIMLTLQMPQQGESQCTATSVIEAAKVLQKVGGGPLGKYNRQYMAFTWLGVQFNFRNLITWGKLSTQATSGTCSPTYKTDKQCDACSVVTDLGAGHYPRYINEIVCDPENALCGNNLGLCKNTVLNQQFLVAVCDPNTGKETLVEYTQPIRACCQCCLT